MNLGSCLGVLSLLQKAKGRDACQELCFWLDRELAEMLECSPRKMQHLQPFAGPERTAASVYLLSRFDRCMWVYFSFFFFVKDPTC